MSSISGEWSGHIAGTNNANVFVEFNQDGVQVQGSARINDPVHGIAVYTVSGSVSGETLQAELHPDKSFFDKQKYQTLSVNGQSVTVKLNSDTGHSVVTVKDQLWSSAIN